MLIKKSLSYPVIILTCFLLLPSSHALSTCFNARGAPPEVWVDDDFDPSTPGWGVTHFDKIQDGINAVAAYGVVNVYDGSYPEHLKINKSVDLIGSDKNTTIIDGGGSGTVVNLHGSSGGTTITGFTIRNSGKTWPDSGLLINHVDKTVIDDNNLENNFVSVHLTNSSGHMITMNDISGSLSCGIGIYCFAESSNNNTITDNLFDEGNNIGIKIFGYDYHSSKGNIIKQNAIKNCLEAGILISGEAGFFVSDINLSENNITDTQNGEGVFLSRTINCTVSKNYFSNNSGDSITFTVNSRNNTITENTIIGNNFGIHVFDDNCYGNYIARNNLINNLYGVSLRDKTYENIVEHNWIDSHSSFGIFLSHSKDNIVRRNFITGCKHEAAIQLNFSDGNDVYQNFITACDKIGIKVKHSEYNHLHDNVVNGCSSGIYLGTTDFNNLVTGNTLSGNNNWGIRLFVPICLQNEIYHNNLINNGIENAEDHNTNTWDDGYPSGGNYYSDYTGQDLNGDGIGDTPYPVPGGNSEDRYPLMTPFGGGALWADDYTFSAGTGGPVNLTLHGDEANAGRNYVILGGMSGTEPGFLLPGGKATMPINLDGFTSIVVGNLNSAVFYNFLGCLDVAGTASAQLNMPTLPPDMIGLTLHFAYTCNKPFDVASNPVGVLIVK